MADNQQADFNVPYKRIEDSFNVAETSKRREAGAMATGQAKDLQANLAQFSPEALKTGASQQGFGEIFSNLNRELAMVSMNFQTEKEKLLLSSEQFLQNMVSQGFVDPNTGNFLRSKFSMDLEMQEINLKAQIEERQRQESRQDTSNLWRGIGQLGSSIFLKGKGKGNL